MVLGVTAGHFTANVGVLGDGGERGSSRSAALTLAGFVAPAVAVEALPRVVAFVGAGAVLACLVRPAGKGAARRFDGRVVLFA